MQQTQVETGTNTAKWRHSLFDALCLPGLRTRWSSVVHLEHIPNAQEELIQWFATQSPGRPVDVTLGSRLILQKHHVLPRKARSQAQKILSLRSEALETASKSNLLAVSHLRERGRTEDKYAQYLIRRDDINRIEEALAANHVPLRSVSFNDDGYEALFVDERASKDGAIRRWWMVFLALIVGICGFSLIAQAQVLRAGEDQLNARSALLAKLQASLDQVVGSSEATQAEAIRLDAVVRALEKGQASASVIANVTNVLSDQIWVSELILLADGQLRISGQASDDVIAMIAKIETTDWAQQVLLARPVRADGITGLSSFDLMIQLDQERL